MIGAVGMMMMIAILGMAKKRQPMWTQTTFTEGAIKGAVDWLKNGTEIEPCEVSVGTAKQIQKDGYDVPDFVMEKPNQMIMILVDRMDSMRRPLLVHQQTAWRQLMAQWLPEVDGIHSENGPIDVLCTDEVWRLKFTRGKAKFSPYVVNIEKVA